MDPDGSNTKLEGARERLQGAKEALQRARGTYQSLLLEYKNAIDEGEKSKAMEGLDFARTDIKLATKEMEQALKDIDYIQAKLGVALEIDTAIAKKVIMDGGPIPTDADGGATAVVGSLSLPSKIVSVSSPPYHVRVRRSTIGRLQGDVEGLHQGVISWSLDQLVSLMLGILIVSAAITSSFLYLNSVLSNIVVGVIEGVTYTSAFATLFTYAYGNPFSSTCRLCAYWTVYLFGHMCTFVLFSIANRPQYSSSTRPFSVTWMEAPGNVLGILRVVSSWFIYGHRRGAPNGTYQKWLILITHLVNYIDLLLESFRLVPSGTWLVATLVPGFVSLAYLVICDRKKPISKDFFYMTCWTFLSSNTGVTLSFFLKAFSGLPEIIKAYSLSIGIQLSSIAFLLSGEITARFATDDSKFITLLLPIYIQVALFQLSTYLNALITANPIDFAIVFIIHQAGGLMKNSGLVEFLTYLLRLFAGELNAVNPYMDKTMIQNMLVRGALDAICELTAVMILLQMVAIEMLVVNNYFRSGFNCMLTCAWTDYQRNMSNFGAIALTLICAMGMRLLCLKAERSVLIRCHVIAGEMNRRVNSIVPFANGGNIVPINYVNLSLKDTISQIFLGERLYLFMWIIFSIIAYQYGVYLTRQVTITMGDNNNSNKTLSAI